MKEKLFGINYNASLIGIDSNIKIVEFGRINNDYYFDYREDKSKNLFFQRNLEFLDICEKNDYENIYYNVIFKYKCNYDLMKNEPTFKISTSRCRIEIEIFMKEACQFIKLPIDDFFIEYKFIICLYYSFFSLMLIIQNEFLYYSVSNSFAFIIISFIIIFIFSFNKFVFIIPFILSIFISISIVNNINKKYPKLNYYILFSVSGFTFGQLIIEIIFSYFKLLNIFEIWIIIIIFIISLNLLAYYYKLCVIIGTFILFSYFISNIYIIWISKRLPILTIIYSLIDDGFNLKIIVKFIYKRYYIYYSIYFFSFIILILIRLLILYNKSQKINTKLFASVFSTHFSYNSEQQNLSDNENEKEKNNDF